MTDVTAESKGGAANPREGRLTHYPILTTRPSDGKTIFYPRGPGHDGYIVDSAARQDYLSRRIRSFTTMANCTFAVLVCPAFFLGWLILFGFSHLVGPYIGAFCAALILAIFIPYLFGLIWVKAAQKRLERAAGDLQTAEALERDPQRPAILFKASLCLFSVLAVGAASIWPAIRPAVDVGPVTGETKLFLYSNMWESLAAALFLPLRRFCC